MCGEPNKRQLGRYVDGESAAAERSEIEVHLASCSACRAELNLLREMTRRIARSPAVSVPDSLWTSIENRMDRSAPTASPKRRTTPFRLPIVRWAIAAGVALTVGLGLFGRSYLNTSARASTVDFGVLLDALPLDAQKAFRRFLVRYDATPTTPVAARRTAPNLNFATPAILPGGFRLRSVHDLRIGGTKGIAASYDRDGEFLAAIFHSPMMHERFGAHENYPCIIGRYCGHKVQVGAWKLVHLTDATTCHCLLTRLDEQHEIPTVMSVIAPKRLEKTPNNAGRRR